MRDLRPSTKWSGAVRATEFQRRVHVSRTDKRPTTDENRRALKYWLAHHNKVIAAQK